MVYIMVVTSSPLYWFSRYCESSKWLGHNILKARTPLYKSYFTLCVVLDVGFRDKYLFFLRYNDRKRIIGRCKSKTRIYLNNILIYYFVVYDLSLYKTRGFPSFYLYLKILQPFRNVARFPLVIIVFTRFSEVLLMPMA